MSVLLNEERHLTWTSSRTKNAMHAPFPSYPSCPKACARPLARQLPSAAPSAAPTHHLATSTADAAARFPPRPLSHSGPMQVPNAAPPWPRQEGRSRAAGPRTLGGIPSTRTRTRGGNGRLPALAWRHLVRSPMPCYLQRVPQLGSRPHSLCVSMSVAAQPPDAKDPSRGRPGTPGGPGKRAGEAGRATAGESAPHSPSVPVPPRPPTSPRAPTAAPASPVRASCAQAPFCAAAVASETARAEAEPRLRRRSTAVVRFSLPTGLTPPASGCPTSASRGPTSI